LVTVGAVVPVVLAAVAGIVVGALRRPLGSHLPDPTIVLPSLGVVAVAIQVPLGWSSTLVAGPLLGLSLFLLTGFALLNRHLAGMGVLALGLSLNAAVVLANGAMPVRPTALVDAGAASVDELGDVDLGAGRRLERTSDWLPVLGDAVPVRPLGAAMSVGDLVALAGIGTVAGELARYTRRGRPSGASVALAAVGRLTRRLGDRLAPEVIGEHRVDRQTVGVGDGLLDGQELHRRDHVVHPEDRLRHRRGHRADGGQGAGVALAGRGGGDGPDEVLARQGQQERPAELGHAGRSVDEVQGLPRRLREVDPGVEEHLLT
jgi:hypothetical protein